MQSTGWPRKKDAQVYSTIILQRVRVTRFSPERSAVNW